MYLLCMYACYIMFLSFFVLWSVGWNRLNANAGDLTNVEVLETLRYLRDMRGRGFSMTGTTTEERARLLEVSRFEGRVMTYIHNTAPEGLQGNMDAAKTYLTVLTSRGITPAEAVQLTNFQPIAEVDLHTVCYHLQPFILLSW